MQLSVNSFSQKATNLVFPIAGLPEIYGLYAAFVPSLLYTFFGTSPHLIVGPTAVMSLLVGHSFKEHNSDFALFKEEIFLASFISGIINLALSTFQLGLVADYISHPVISGFTSSKSYLYIGNLT